MSEAGLCNKSEVLGGAVSFSCVPLCVPHGDLRKRYHYLRVSGNATLESVRHSVVERINNDQLIIGSFKILCEFFTWPTCFVGHPQFSVLMIGNRC